MKLFTFKKPVSFGANNIEINDLSYNHKYKPEGKYLVVEGEESSCLKRSYKAYYDKRGKFSYVVVRRQEKSKAMLCWKQEYRTEYVERINRQGNRILTISVYMTTDTVEDKLIRKSFVSEVNGQGLCEIMFELNSEGKWCSKGHILPEHRKYWLTKK